MSVPLQAAHPDYVVLRPLVTALYKAAGGEETFALEVPQILRRAIDEVIDASRTNRFTLSEVEKTEKTYLGTKVEILLRAFLGLPRGRILDLSVAGVETDIKNTMGSNWTIPMEAVGHPCLLLKENERKALCSVGMIVARDTYLNPGKNRDAKRTFSAAALGNIWWLLRDHPYPANFWETLPGPIRTEVMQHGGGTQRLATLFRLVQRRAISRAIVQAVAQQDDYMKRIRKNGGARDILSPLGIAVLWGQKDKAIIEHLHLGPVGLDEFISYQPTEAEEVELLQRANHID